MICLRETPRGDQRTTEIPTRNVRARGCARFMRDLGLMGDVRCASSGSAAPLSRASCLVSSSCEGPRVRVGVRGSGAPAVALAASRDASP